MGLPRDQRIRRPEEFKRVLSTGRKAADLLLAVTAAPYDGEGPRFGLSVSKRIGTAVERNRLKRRLREVIRGLGLTGPWSIVVTARPAAAEATLATLQESLTKLVSRMGWS